MEGWIKLHRQIQKHWLYQEKRTFSKYEAWLDIVMMANHQDNRFVLGNEVLQVERGSFVTSELKLMDHWRWSKTKLRNFLSLLENEGMIAKISDNKKTTIKVLNYSAYQQSEDHKVDNEETAERPREDTNKNVKNDKNEKKIKYAEFVTFYESEYQKLVSEFGEEATRKMISTLDNYKGSKGKKYVSDYRAVLNWVVDRIAGTSINGVEQTSYSRSKGNEGAQEKRRNHLDSEIEMNRRFQNINAEPMIPLND